MTMPTLRAELRDALSAALRPSVDDLWQASYDAADEVLRVLDEAGVLCLREPLPKVIERPLTPAAVRVLEALVRCPCPRQIAERIARCTCADKAPHERHYANCPTELAPDIEAAIVEAERRGFKSGCDTAKAVAELYVVMGLPDYDEDEVDAWRAACKNIVHRISKLTPSAAGSGADERDAAGSDA